MGEQEEESPKLTLFSQQRNGAWRPYVTQYGVFSLLFSVGLVLVIVGIVIFLFSKKAVEFEMRYDDKCTSYNAECTFDFELPETFSGNIFMYYKLTNFFQSHQRYIYSRDYAQLRGDYRTYDELTDCGDFRAIGDPKNPANWLLPSGASPLSLFNDTFAISTTEASAKTNFLDSGISWPSDKDKLFKRLSSKYEVGITWLNNSTVFHEGQTDEHFIVWMRPSSTQDFYKLYYRCPKCVLPKGKYTMKIQNNYPTSSFSGKKYFMITKVNGLGGQLFFLGYGYIAVGCVCAFAGLIVVVTQMINPRKMGDTDYLLQMRRKA